MNYTTTNEDVEIIVVPTNSKTSFDINDKELVVGNNIIYIIITAENGDEEIYELIVDKWSSTKETVNAIIGLGVMRGTGYGIYYFVKKRKTIQKNKNL